MRQVPVFLLRFFVRACYTFISLGISNRYDSVRTSDTAGGGFKQMMVNCPKCGFSQPQDQYCARCGIDMITFRPAQRPFFARLISSTLFQLVALTIIVVGVFSVARQMRHREVAERVSEIENARNSQVLSHRAAEAAKSELASTASIPQPASTGSTQPVASPTPQLPIGPQPATAALSAADSAPPPQVAPQPVAAGANATDDKSQNPTSAGVAARAPTSARVIFAQVAHSVLSDLAANSDPRSASSQGSIFSGVVANFQARLKTAQNAGDWEILDSSTHPLKANQVVEFYGGQREETTGQFLGFVVELMPTQLDDNESHVNLRTWRYMREAGNQVEEFSIPLPENVTIPHGGGAFIAGALTKRSLNDADRRFYDPLKILHLLATEEYRQGTTDFVIYIEPR
jgi:hypothetical protein